MNLHITEAWLALKEFMSPAKATILCTHCGESLERKTVREQTRHLEEHRKIDAANAAAKTPLDAVEREIEVGHGVGLIVPPLTVNIPMPHGARKPAKSLCETGARKIGPLGTVEHCQLAKGHIGAHRYVADPPRIPKLSIGSKPRPASKARPLPRKR
jgi:hypothetical protein